MASVSILASFKACRATLVSFTKKRTFLKRQIHQSEIQACKHTLVVQLGLEQRNVLFQLALLLLKTIDNHVLALLVHLELVLVQLGLLGGATNDGYIATNVLFGIGHVEDLELQVVALLLQIANFSHFFIHAALVLAVHAAYFTQLVLHHLSRLAGLVEAIVLFFQKHLMLGELLLKAVQLNAKLFALPFGSLL